MKKQENERSWGDTENRAGTRTRLKKSSCAEKRKVRRGHNFTGRRIGAMGKRKHFHWKP